MERQTKLTCWEFAAYAVILLVACALAVVGHIVDYGWAWNWPLAGSGFELWVDMLFVSVLGAAIVVVTTVLRYRQSAFSHFVRAVACLAILFAPFCLSLALGPLANQWGKGLEARVREEVPRNALQAWAISELAAHHTGEKLTIPPNIAQSLPSGAEAQVHEGFVDIRWYDRGIAVGARDYVPAGTSFFQRQIQPGLYVYVNER